jgi:ADP-ribose pyrophosphatase
MKIKRIREEVLYKGKVLLLKKVEIRLNKEKIEKEIACFHLPRSVGILPLIDKNKIILIRHYRTAARKELWEIPAGFLKRNEKPEVGAKRELKEETGFLAKRLKKIAEFYFSPGYLRECMYLFRATRLKKGKQMLDEGEMIKEVKIFSLKKALGMVKKRKILDAKSIIAILLEAYFSGLT